MESLAGKKALLILTNESYLPKSPRRNGQHNPTAQMMYRENGPVVTGPPSTWISPVPTINEPPASYAAIPSTQGFFAQHHQPTGVDIFELGYLWMQLHKQLKMDLVFCTPRGGPVAADPISVERMEKDSRLKDHLKNELEFVRKMGHTLPISWVKPEEFHLCVIVGGHGAMFDLPEHEDIACTIAEIYRKNGHIAAIGHGVAGLLNVRKERRGEYLIKGKKITCPTKDEERQVGYDNYLPYLLEERIKERGANLHNKKAFESNVVVDDRIITAQNAPSVQEFVQKIHEHHARR